MDVLVLLQTSSILFGIGAAGGLVMAAVRFGGKRNPPAWLSMLHGFLAAAGLTLLAVTALFGPMSSWSMIALVLLGIAAIGGVVLNLCYRTQQRLIPSWLVTMHALLAVTGLLFLFGAAFFQH